MYVRACSDVPFDAVAIVRIIIIVLKNRRPDRESNPNLSLAGRSLSHYPGCLTFKINSAGLERPLTSPILAMVSGLAVRMVEETMGSTGALLLS